MEYFDGLHSTMLVHLSSIVVVSFSIKIFGEKRIDCQTSFIFTKDNKIYGANMSEYTIHNHKLVTAHV